MSGQNGLGAQIRKVKAIKQARKEEREPLILYLLPGPQAHRILTGHYEMHILIPTKQVTKPKFRERQI